MTGADAYKLHLVRIGDRVEYRDHGAIVSGEVCGWTSEHMGVGVMMLVYGGWHGPDKRVPLHAVLSRERPGLPGIVRFE